MTGMTGDEAARYLEALGLERRPPTRGALTGILAAHLERVPFENVSKLQRAHRGLPPGLPSLDEFLDAVVRDRLGGTCYLLNPLLGELLIALGYRCELRGADMDQPDVHVVNVVELDGASWLVDVGYGAPFFVPMSLDAATELELHHGRDTYVLRPRGTDGRSRLDQCRGGEIIHGYTVKPGARRIAEFAPIVVDSYRADSTFLNQLRIVRHRPGRSVDLRDFTVKVLADGGFQHWTLPNRQAVQEFVTEEFGITPAVLDEALAELAVRSAAWRIF